MLRRDADAPAAHALLCNAALALGVSRRVITCTCIIIRVGDDYGYVPLFPQLGLRASIPLTVGGSMHVVQYSPHYLDVNIQHLFLVLVLLVQFVLKVSQENRHGTY